MAKKLADMDVAELAAHLKESQLNNIEKQLKFVSSRLEELQPLIELQQRLQAARRAMLNERAVASGGGRGLSQSEVIAWLGENGASTVYEIAQGLSVTEAVVRGHLNRGKDERFEKTNNNHWQLREPENEEDDDE
jgi:hypothetical protein